MLTEDEAVTSAREALAGYPEPADGLVLSRVDWSEEDLAWWVHLVTREPRPGGLVTVVVDGRTGECRVLPGK